MGTPRSRRMGPAMSPRAEPAVPALRYSPTSNGMEIVPESVFASLEYRSDGHRPFRGSYRPRYAENAEWEYPLPPPPSEQQPLSPRGAGHYQPSQSMLQRKSSGRAPVLRHPEGPIKVPTSVSKHHHPETASLLSVPSMTWMMAQDAALDAMPG